MPFIDAIGNLVGKGESVVGTRAINLSTIGLGSGVDTTTTGTENPDGTSPDTSTGDPVISDDSDLTLDTGEVALNIPSLVRVGSVSDVRVSTTVANSGDSPDAVDYEFENFQEVNQGAGTGDVVAGEIATFDSDNDGFSSGDKKIEGNVVVVQIHEGDDGADSTVTQANTSFDPLAVQVNAEGY